MICIIALQQREKTTYKIFPKLGSGPSAWNFFTVINQKIESPVVTDTRTHLYHASYKTTTLLFFFLLPVIR